MALLLVQWRIESLPWGLARLPLGVLGTRAPGLRFARVLGSGRDGGFGLVPSLRRQGLVAFFDDEPAARAFVEHGARAQAYRRHASEFACALLRATACRGTWGGCALAVTATARDGQPMASLTRASIRPRHARAFWRHSPAAQRDVARAPGCRLAVGLGEAPLLRQATFSLWDDAGAMQAYAHGAAHQRAIDGAWRDGWFSESLFARLVPIDLQGHWHGRALA